MGGAAGGGGLRIGLVRGAAPPGASNFSRLEADASAQLDLPVAAGLLLR